MSTEIPNPTRPQAHAIRLDVKSARGETGLSLRNRRRRWTANMAMVLVLACGTAFSQNLTFGSRAARPVQPWLQKSSIYELWLNGFSKEGNLRGAIPGLKHIAELGATIVYLGPIAKRSANPKASPYSIADYNAIDPECGTEQDLRDFVAAAHKLNLKVMLDIVYYHTAPDNVMMQADPEFFVKTETGEIARGFWPQPLPDYSKGKVRKYLIDSLVHWAHDFDIDGFRCDVGGGIPEYFWVEARRALNKINPEIVLLSESDRPDDQLEAFDMNYNFHYYLALRSVLRDGSPALGVRKRNHRCPSSKARQHGKKAFDSIAVRTPAIVARRVLPFACKWRQYRKSRG
jgi:glycosidase